MNSNLLSGQNILAIVLLILGGGFLLDQLGVLDFGSILSTWWPLAIIGYGLIEFVRSGQKSLFAVFIIGVGAILLLTRLNNADINWWAMFWPAVMIIAGLSLLFRRPPTGLSAEKSVNEFTLFGGIEKHFSSKAFEGGSASVGFGGIKLDLRKAEMAKDARLDVFVMFGGVELIVPENCKIVNRSVAILGGTEDKTHFDKDAGQVLIVTGTILFGGLEIKN